VPRSCSLYADDRPASNQVASGLIPAVVKKHWFWSCFRINDASSAVHFRSASLALTWLIFQPFPLRSIPQLFIAAPKGGLEPAPEHRLRGAFPHLL